MRIACLVCDKEINICASHYRRGQGRFCSRECFIKHKRATTYLHIKCETCGETFNIPQSKAKGTRGKFCSRKCFHKWHASMIGDILKGLKLSHPAWNKNKKLPPISEWHKKQISNAVKGDKNPAWKGGISFIPYPVGWTKTFKEQIRFRDKYICQICGIPEAECYRKLHVHHIDYNKSNLDEKNLISLCISCHGKTQFNRKYWQDLFAKRRVDHVYKGNKA